jgi:hypothetical protein
MDNDELKSIYITRISSYIALLKKQNKIEDAKKAQGILDRGNLMELHTFLETLSIENDYWNNPNK